MAPSDATPAVETSMGEGQVLLRAAGLGKIYARSPDATRRRIAKSLGAALLGGRAPDIGLPQGKEFWAVRDVSFELRQGRALGVIGLNGSGKTTLLRMLAGQILPDNGEITVYGKSAAMIDLTAGFSSGASGRRNIYMRAAALGFSAAETDEMVDEIIEFSELGDVIDAPISTYSSGMQMRLAFSVMAMVSPDVLFIDEVLAVGDFRFRQKCLSKIREMRERSAFVFVSHSMGDIARFCDEVIVLYKGKVDFFGAPETAIEHFLDMERDDQPLTISTTAEGTPVKASADHKAAKNLQLNVFDPTPHHDNSAVSGVTISVKGAVDGEIRCETMSPLDFCIRAEILRPCRRLVFGYTILTDQGEGVSGVASDSQNEWLKIEQQAIVAADVHIEKLILNPGRYSFYFNMRDGNELLFRGQIFSLLVHTPPYNTFGIVTMPHAWRLSATQKEVTAG